MKLRHCIVTGFLLIPTLAIVLPMNTSAQTTADKDAVRQAVLNYVEGFYEGDSTKIAHGVHPDVNKRGFFVPRGASPGEYNLSPMSFEQMFEYTRGVRESGNVADASAPKDIEIFDILDQIASAKLTAFWGVDYLLLAKADGEWKIWQVLWQTPPPTN